MNNVEHHSHRPVNTKSKKRRLENKTEDEETVIQKQPSPKPSFSECRSIMHKQSHRRRSESESAGANWNVGAVGIEMPKFEAKKGDFAKIWQKLGGYSPPTPPSMNLCIPKILEYQTRVAK